MSRLDTWAETFFKVWYTFLYILLPLIDPDVILENIPACTLSCPEKKLIKEIKISLELTNQLTG